MWKHYSTIRFSFFSNVTSKFNQGLDVPPRHQATVVNHDDSTTFPLKLSNYNNLEITRCVIDCSFSSDLPRLIDNLNNIKKIYPFVNAEYTYTGNHMITTSFPSQLGLFFI